MYVYEFDIFEATHIPHESKFPMATIELHFMQRILMQQNDFKKIFFENFMHQH